MPSVIRPRGSTTTRSPSLTPLVTSTRTSTFSPTVTMRSSAFPSLTTYTRLVPLTVSTAVAGTVSAGAG